MKRLRNMIALSFICSSLLLAGEKEDFQRIDQSYRQKDFDLALRESLQYIKNYPSSPRLEGMREQLGKLYFVNKQYAKAREQFRILLNSGVTGGLRNEAYYYLSRINAALGEKDKQEFDLLQIREGSAYYAKAYYDTAMQYMVKGEYREAIPLLESQKHRGGDYHKKLLLNLGIAYFNVENFPKAKKYLGEYASLEKNRNQSLVAYLRGTMLYKEGETGAARDIFVALSQKDQKSLYGQKGILTLIEIDSNRGDTAKVEAWLRLLEGSPAYARAMTMLGDLYVTQGEYQKALRMYDKSPMKKDARGEYGKAYALYKLGRLKEALPYFYDLQNSQYYNQAIYHIFAIEYRLGHYKTVLEHRDLMKRVVLTQTDNDNINTMIANSAYELGDYQLSKEYFGRLYAITPKKDNLFRIIMMDSKNLDLADITRRFADYKKYYADDREHKKEIYQAVGECYFKLGQTPKAIEVYQEYLASSMPDTEIQQALVVALLKEQRYEELDASLALVPMGAERDYLEGIALMGKGESKAAEVKLYQLYSNLPEGSPLAEKVQKNRLRNFFLLENYAAAIQIGEAYLQNYSTEDAEVVDKLALSYFREGNYEKARSYDRVLAKLPGYEEYGNFQKANSYYYAKEYTKAAQELKLFMEIYPSGKYTEQANYYYVSSLALSKQDVAFEAAREAFQAKYPGSSFQANLDNLDKTLTSKAAKDYLEEHINSGSIEEKKEQISKLQDPEDQLYYQAKLDEKAGKKEAARKSYEALLSSLKYQEYAHLQLANYYERKNPAKAKSLYQKLLSLKGKTKADFLHFKIAEMAMKQKKEQEALSHYRKAYKLKGKYEDKAMLKAVEIYEKMGDKKSVNYLYNSLSRAKDKEIQIYALEKLVYNGLEAENLGKAKKAYLRLRKLSPKAAKKYQDFFE